MDSHPSASGDGMPTPPYSLGDPLSRTAAEGTTEALRKVLARHRRRQLQVGGTVLVVALLAGSLSGFAIGRQGRGAGVTHLAAGNPAPTKSNAAAGGAGQPGFSNSSSSSASSAIAVAPMKPQSTQLLVRNAKDGVRVRLYEQTFPVPQVSPPKCMAAPNSACPEVAVPPAVPGKLLVAEVSDDQVAGQAEVPVTQNFKVSGFDSLAAQVVGLGQPQPILVVIGHAGSGVATVDVTTPYGSDSAAPGVGGWVALAVQLPADYHVATDSGGSALQGVVPTGTITAHSPSGGAVDSIALSKLEAKIMVQPECGTSMGGATAAPTTTVTTVAGAKSAGANSGAGAAAASPPNAMICDSSGSSGSASSSSASSSSGSSGPGAAANVPVAP